MSKRQREPEDPRVHSGDSLTEKDALILKSASQFAEATKEQAEQRDIQSNHESDWASDASGDDQDNSVSPPHTLSTTIIEAPGFKNEKSSMFIEAMLEKGADVNARDIQDWTPLHVAAYYGQEDVCEVLAKVQGIDLDAKNSHGDSPLHMAAKWPHGESSFCMLLADFSHLLLQIRLLSASVVWGAIPTLATRRVEHLCTLQLYLLVELSSRSL